MADRSTRKFLLVVAGPTAVGKTNAAILIAEHFGTEIVSADARQIYQGIDIGTAKPNTTELERVKHHLINAIPLTQSFSVYDYEREAIRAIASIHETHDLCILVGGSGLYLKAVMEGLDELPDVPHYVRDEIDHQWKKLGLEWLQKQVATADPEYFEIADVNNPRRLIRALSFTRHTGRRYSSFLNGVAKVRPFKIIPILITLPREVLYERINRRVEQMIQKGLKEEARSLLHHAELQALATVGYQEFFAFFRGEISEEEAVRLIKRNSRRYAKRQMTWFRKYGDWIRTGPDNLEEIIELIEGMIFR